MREKALLMNLKNVALVALLLSTGTVVSQKKNKKDKDKTEQVADSLKSSKGKNYNTL